MAEVEKFDRGARRKARTRKKLLEAAGTLFAKKAHEDVSIVDITEAADVGLGTFYNHFASKVELLEALADQFLLEYAEELDALVQDCTDPAEILCLSYRYTVRCAKDPIGWAIIRQMPQNYVRGRLEARARGDISVGVKTGRFKVDDAEAFTKFMAYSLIGILEGLADEALTLEQTDSYGVYFLRLLGIDSKEAEALFAEPLPGE